MLANVSALVDVNWWLGIPFNDTSDWRLEIAQTGEAILGERLLGFQVGNEPDLYADHGHRQANYSVWDYFGEFAEIIDAIAADTAIPKRNNLIAPSVSGTWTPEDVWSTGFLTSYDSSLGALAVEKCVRCWRYGLIHDFKLTHATGIQMTTVLPSTPVVHSVL